MSLDVYLRRRKFYEEHETENDDDCVFEANITHNLGNMASEAGIYEACWRPHRLKPDYNVPEHDHNAEWEFEKNSVTKAAEIIPLLEKGLADMMARPTHYEQFNASNGWGLYKNFLPWVAKYLEACKEYPDAIVVVSR